MKKKTKKKSLLPTVSKAALPVQKQQAQSLAVIANSLNSLATFVSSGGLSQALQGMALSNAASGLLQGLTAHDGRNGLDARTISQNATEITHLVMSVHEKFAERLRALAKGERRDPDMHDAEKEFKESEK